MFALLNILNFYTGKWMSKGLLILVAILIYCFVMRQMHDEIMGNKAYMITIIILMITDLVTIFTLFSDEKENEKVEGGSKSINASCGGKEDKQDAKGIVKKIKSMKKTKRDKNGNVDGGKKKDVVDDLPPKPDVKNAKNNDKQEIDVYDANELSINTYE